MFPVRVFEVKSVAKVYAKGRPSPPIHLIRHVVEFVQNNVLGPLTNAVDLGCGTGQCTFVLGDFFQHVLGTDISEAQVDEAKKECVRRGVKNIDFKISPGEVISVPDKSVQLITICTAAHYMNLDKVYEEGRRVLVPGGVLAILCLDGMPEINCTAYPEKNIEFQNILHQTREPFYKYLPTLLKKGLETQNRNITIPYNDLTRGFDFVGEREISLEQICNFIQSFSFYQILVNKEGQSVAENLLTSFKKRTMELLTPEGEFTNDMKIFTEKAFYFLIMART